MTWSPGTRLGPYVVEGPLGAGGMGEVFLARDTRLGREVAIKRLTGHREASAEARARFEREARVISGLNHPRICVLHDVGHEDGVDFLVMERIEGETLAHRIARGPLPPAEVARLGAQIAEALDAAHRAGVIHRDLKPANVMLTRSGIKLMDFGLARATPVNVASLADASTTATQSATAMKSLTAEGEIVGTFQYMAPEQLEGRDADARSDLWALGCVLHEMATARPAFSGGSPASLIAAIMGSTPPPVSQLGAQPAPALDRVVSACLVRDPAERAQNAHDVKLQLEWVAESLGSGAGSAGTPRDARSRAVRVGQLVGVAIAAAALAFVLAWQMGRRAAPELALEAYSLGSLELMAASAPALSPDGKSLVVSVAAGASSSRLVRRDFDAIETMPVANTENGYSPFFSPDGRWIGFLTDGAIRKVPAGGGQALIVASVPHPAAATWSDDGWIYFSPQLGGPDGVTAVAKVSQTGGQIFTVATLDTLRGESDARYPEVLPRGRGILFAVQSGTGGNWSVQGLDRHGTRRTVVEHAHRPRFVPPDRLLYVDLRSSIIVAAPFDATTLRITGSPIPVTEEVDGNRGYNVLGGDRLVFAPRAGTQQNEIVQVQGDGATRRLGIPQAPWRQPRVSPDGSSLVIRKVGANCELWLDDLASGSLSPLVQANDNHSPVWSPDGGRIAFYQARRPIEVVALSARGARERRTVVSDPLAGEPGSWTGAGDRLAYIRSDRKTGVDLWVKAVDDSSAPTRFLATAANEWSPEFSRDGRWIAYMSDETGRSEIFLRPYAGSGGAWQVSRNGGADPLWSRDGRRIYFRSGTALWEVPVETHPEVRIGAARKRMEGLEENSPTRNFDEAPDGSFIVSRPVEGGGIGRELRVLLHWERMLERAGGR